MVLFVCSLIRSFARIFALFFFLMIRRPPRSTRTDTLFPYTPLFRSSPRARFRAAHSSPVRPAPLRIRTFEALWQACATVRSQAQPGSDRQPLAGYQRVIGAMRDRTVTPSLILKKLSPYRQQTSLAAALHQVGRIERTRFTQNGKATRG